jgi:AraC-like DNA-binding protein
MAGPWINPDDYDQTPRPVVGIGNQYPPSFELATHTHGRGQLLYAAKGVVVVSTPHGTFVAPSERAVWTPAGMPHAVRMVGNVATRSVLLDAATSPVLGAQSAVIGVSPLLRHLLIAACDIAPEYAEEGRDGLVMRLLLAELEQAPRLPLSVPFPASPALAALCHAFLERPTPHAAIDDWADRLAMDRRSFTRRFRRETGLSFGAWRQQACLVSALPLLAEGRSVTTVALDLGYDSPAAFSTMFRRLAGVSPSRYAAGEAG